MISYAEAVQYVLFCLTNNRPFLYDKDTAFNVLYPIFKEKGIIINHSFINDLIAITPIFDVIRLSYDNLFMQFIDFIRQYLIAGVPLKLTDKLQQQFYTQVKKICDNLSQDVYTDLVSLQNMRREVFEANLLDKNLASFIFKYDVYLFGKTEVVVSIHELAAMVALLDGRFAYSAYDDMQIVDPHTKDQFSIPQSSGNNYELVALPHNRLLGIGSHGAHSLYNCVSGATLYKSDEVEIHTEMVAVFEDVIVITGRKEILFTVISIHTGEIVLSVDNIEDQKINEARNEIRDYLDKIKDAQTRIKAAGGTVSEECEYYTYAEEGDEALRNAECMAALGTDFVIIGYFNRIPQVYNIRTGQFVINLGNQKIQLQKILVSDDAIIGILYTSVIIWDSKTGVLHDTLNNSDLQIINSVLLPGNQIVISDGLTLNIWDFSTSELIFTVSIPTKENSIRLWMGTELLIPSEKKLGILNLNTKQSRILTINVEYIDILKDNSIIIKDEENILRIV